MSAPVINILVVEPLDHWHWDLDAFFVRALQTIGRVTFVAPQGYLTSCDVDSRIDIPSIMYDNKSSLDKRLSGIRVINYIKNNICLEKYDVVVFLSYELIPMFLRWPRSKHVFAFEHNNASNLEKGWLKKLVFRSTSNKISSIAFQQHTAEYLNQAYGRGSFYVPHPYYRTDVDDKGRIVERKIDYGEKSGSGALVIASLSGSTVEESNEALKEMARDSQGKLYVICKGKIEQNSEYYEIRTFFENYKEVIENCDAVFVGAEFEHRVSGVAYEALSYGKPLILMDCQFARELQRHYPKMVYVVKNMCEILTIELSRVGIDEDCEKFLAHHSYDSIASILSKCLADYVQQSCSV